MGKAVTVVLLFWTNKKLAEGRIDDIDFPPEYDGATHDVRRLLREKKVSRISDLFNEARLVGQFRLVACSAGLEYTGVDSDAVIKQVGDVMGLQAILAFTAGAETTLFI
jgi:peroxiredoxin family protein